MLRVFVVLLTSAVVFTAFALSAAAETRCPTYAEKVNEVMYERGDILRGRGVDPINERSVELFVDAEDRSFTILFVEDDGTVCYEVPGDAWLAAVDTGS